MSSITFNFGKNEAQVKAACIDIEQNKIIERIWKKDYTVWSSNPSEISNRLGWLDSPFQMKDSIAEINDFAAEVRKEGFRNVLLLGMGGSSLAPEVFSRIFGTADNSLNLYVLDSTHPDYINEYVEKFASEKTLYIVSTKSGGTIETISFLKFFFTLIAKKEGSESAGRFFAAITDPGSGLEDYAKKLNFRKIFLNNPDIGGRFSAVSMFGLVPAALIGADIEKLLTEAYKIINESKDKIDFNSPAKTGVMTGILAALGNDKLTFIISKQINSFGVWVEQLIAESTGKIGKGILPVEGERILVPDEYKKDKVFVYVKLKGENEYDKEAASLEERGFPVIRIVLDSKYELCAEFFRWEFATAVMGYFLGVQPFDQPDVESAKILARETIKAYKAEGKLPELKPALIENGMEIVTDLSGKGFEEIVNSFFAKYLDKEKGYVSIQAYLLNDDKTASLLQELRNAIQNKYKVSTTIGVGPRFLHSTGQLHKGDGGNGLFIQLISKNKSDFDIPEEPLSENSSFTFGVLVSAQSLGDRQALLNGNRKVLRISSADIKETIIKLTGMF